LNEIAEENMYPAQINNPAHIPTTYVLVKGIGMKKHSIHMSEVAHIPATSVLIEHAGLAKQRTHI